MILHQKERKYNSYYSLQGILMQFTILIILQVNGYADKEDGTIYLLIWTTVDDMPFRGMQLGRESFLSRNCSFTNCYITDKPSFFSNILDFDVIMFNVGRMYHNMELPNKRSPKQNYLLVAMEPAAIDTIPAKYNKFFNMTWTYKLDSDVIFPYIVVKNEYGEIVGPKMDMHWIDVEKMNETSLFIRNKLRKKKTAAAWFVSNCYKAPSKRLEYVTELQKELSRYGEAVDVYGLCGDKHCSWHDGDECFALIESNYYFYLSFENSFCEDYVTEKLLTALEHYAVPVVYGGANYTRFIPDGIYLNARTMVPAKLAEKMVNTMRDRKAYYDFFKWHGYYSFHFTGENNFRNEICGLCEFLNSDVAMNRTRVYRTNLWWNEWYNGPPAPQQGPIKLIIDEETTNATGLSGIVSNFYKYMFE